MLAWIDDILNRTTMYRLVLYYLAALLALAFVFGFFGILPYDPAAIAFSFVVIATVCWITNWICARIFDAVTNVESVYITAFILALIITPVMATNHVGLGFLIFASVWAMASKYLLAIGKRHVFNPAAFGVALSAFVIGQSATWWVGGNLPLLGFVVVGGLLMVRKIQRFDLVGSFALVALAASIATAGSGSSLTVIMQTILHSSFFFFAFVMLTEPLTTPPNRGLRIAYGALVGFFFAPNVHIGSFYFSPELALLVGNIFSYIVSPKGRFMLTLTRIEESAKDAYDFIFTSDRKFSFSPGQYMEWTLAHRYPDNRGNRRYFTLASSPTEDAVRLGVKFYPQASTFKRALSSMKVGDTISAAHLAGGFVLPKDSKKKLVFIAGGIGVTPFRSMVQYLLDKKEVRDIVVLYANKTVADIAYKDVFDRAANELGIRTLYSLTGEKAPVPGMYNGAIDAQLIAQQIPDYRERIFYISGPHAMVNAFGKTLRDMGVSRFKIKSDFFPGFA
jgi:ferredoxin-NADP reductase/Na+-translocating ferredoxin:NAD+ oxidoreductase RnfD subunit